MLPNSQPSIKERRIEPSRSIDHSSGTSANQAVNQSSNGGNARISSTEASTASSAFVQAGKNRAAARRFMTTILSKACSLTSWPNQLAGTQASRDRIFGQTDEPVFILT